jgi:tetratricopeptide (TPR) repeat protein
LWAESSELDLVRLFERLEHFYLRWCDGEFIDASPENLPQYKMRLLKEQLPGRKPPLGLRQVDVYTGLNVMILLLELHRYAKTKDELKNKIIFYPCGQPDTEEFDRERLRRINGYGQCLGANTYHQILRRFLSQANLSRTDLSEIVLRGGANLSRANLSQADLSRADFFLANLRGANLSGAFLFQANLMAANLSGASLFQVNLSGASLFQANLSGANLSGANLSGANLKELKWNSTTKWANAMGLHEAVGVPPELTQDPTFSAAILLSRGISWVREGKVEEAIQAYNQAQSLDPNLEIMAVSWSILCVYGSLHGHAADVLYAGENAVNLEPDNKRFQFGRGIARVLTGDLSGALADFQEVLDSDVLGESEDMKYRWQRWVEALKAGEKPFTPEELETLWQAEG